LLRHKNGATIAEFARATGWQTTASADSFSGTIAKKMNLLVASFKNEKGERVYKAR
jgi:hypothetical protein